MRELSLHILDVMENAVEAGASRIRVEITEDLEKDLLAVEIEDNGKGMSQNLVKEVLNPFYTTRNTRHVGLGLPLFSEAARRCDGTFRIESAPGKGTRVRATFRHSHIDRAPIGDLPSVFIALLAGNPGVDFIYRHTCEGVFELDTREIRKEIGEIPLNHTEVLTFIRRHLREGLGEIGTEARIAHHEGGGEN